MASVLSFWIIVLIILLLISLKYSLWSTDSFGFILFIRSFFIRSLPQVFPSGSRDSSKDVKTFAGKQHIAAQAPVIVGEVRMVLVLLGSSLEAPQFQREFLAGGHKNLKFGCFLLGTKPLDAPSLFGNFVGVGEDGCRAKSDGASSGGGNGSELFFSPEDRDGLEDGLFRGFFFFAGNRELVVANVYSFLGGSGIRVLQRWVSAVDGADAGGRHSKDGFNTGLAIGGRLPGIVLVQVFGFDWQGFLSFDFFHEIDGL